MKRKAQSQAVDHKPSKKKSKTSLPDEEAKKRFRKGLFDKKVLEEYTQGYAKSTPYKHSVIHELIDDKLLRTVREEIKSNVSFTPKETDIYKIHQSGDLANLDGLDDDALSKLPSLLALRDAMYSQSFRDYVAHITGCGPLSGRKTDMAINIYTPGCYLLCHDDVIGSRKVSYILYLTDPDIPWKAEWGGALRLFPVRSLEGADGQVAKTILPDVSKVIPPAWNQLSFFAVQPGESFHDVEEVYHAETKKQLEKDGGRVRMAISGWFHIPQIGEDGYVEGAEEKQAKNSGLMQLQGNPDQYDMPQSKPVAVEKPQSTSQEEFDETDLEFLLKYMAPTYLTPDTIEQIAEHFDEDSSITLPSLLGKKFSQRLRDFVTAQESAPLPEASAEIEKGPWRVAKPPHKHRYLYLQAADTTKKQAAKEEDSPIRELLEEFLPSPQFRRWLQMATGCVIESHDFLARRFRRGKDYTLATGHEGKTRLELNLGITPTTGWGDEVEEEAAAEDNNNDEEEEEEEEESAQQTEGKGKAKAKARSKSKTPNGKKTPETEQQLEEEAEVGGHEVYMAGDDDDEDAAVYKSGSSGGGGDDDNILFFQAAAWNKMSIVLRDSGVLKFVKYVSRRAKGDRWDICGTFEVEEQQEDDDDGDEGGQGTAANNGDAANAQLLEDDTEEEWRGFSPSSESDSD
ncbi:Oxoglutarate and iron-dependent oxygenase degradation C-term-domain-containing protein [Xylariaceae sp. FL0662B]|nr:Oxoglutarate and iron-dependent oxygenase degradation C-term-domain-containing protein [Xylariaceae sp. FL0662B]